MQREIDFKESILHKGKNMTRWGKQLEDANQKDGLSFLCSIAGFELVTYCKILKHCAFAEGSNE